MQKVLSEILFITHKYPPSTGGMEKFSFELIEGFRQSNIKVHALVADGKESKLKWFLRLKDRVNQIFENNPNIQIVHVNDGLMAYFCRWIQAKFNVPVIPTFHGLDIVFPVGMYQHKIIPSYAKSFHSFVCVSNATAQAAIDRSIPASQIAVITNGVDHDIAQLESNPALQNKIFKSIGLENYENKFIIVGLGRGVRRKGYGWFVQNVLPLLDKNIIFIMLGPRTSYEKYEKIVRKILPGSWKKSVELLLGLSTDDGVLAEALQSEILKGKYFRPGYMKFSDITQILIASHLFIMPNLKEQGDMEGFGLVALEASLSGTLVLASNIDGITDAIIDGKNGIHISSGNAKAWIDTIHNLAMHKKIVKQKGSESRQYTISHYGWKKMTNDYLQYFTKVINS